MNTERTPSLRSIHELSANGRFSYGKAHAKKIDEAEFAKNSRVVTKRVAEIISALNLPLSVSGPAQSISHDNGNAYTRVTGDGNEFFVMVRNPINEKPINEIVQGQLPDVEIISGPCLFSDQSVVATTNDGNSFHITSPREVVTQPIETISVNPELSLYEAEAVVRVSAFIAQLCKRPEGVTKIHLNIPRVDYYFYILQAYSLGMVNSQQAGEWFDHVDRRQARLANLISARIRKKSGKNPAMSLSEPLSATGDYVRNEVASGRIPSLQKSITILAESDPLWQLVFNNELDLPRSWIDLNFIGYAVAELAVAHVNLSNKKPKVAIAVENPTESKIFASAKKIYGRLQKNPGTDFNLIGMYPHELVLPTGEYADKTMYDVFQPKGDGTHHARTIFSAYKKNGHT